LPNANPPSADRQSVPVGQLPLSDYKIMIVEDEFLIAEDVAALVRDAGGQVIGPAVSLPEGMRLAADTETIDAAVLNIDLDGVAVFPLADELQARGVRIMFLTGFAQSSIPDDYAAVPCCRKPTAPACVIVELKLLLAPMRPDSALPLPEPS
jgi:DNA-binding response OmpR family regulator